MTIIRNIFLGINVAMLSLISLWAYSSHRYDGLNIGGEKGGVDFWLRMGDLGCYGGLSLWVICVIAALWAAGSGKFSAWVERSFWILLPLFGAPVLLFSLNAIFNAGIAVVG